MARNILCLLALAMVSLALCAAHARAADPGDGQSIRTIRLQLSPAPEPLCALEYRFETSYAEHEPGNAAFLYQTAVGQMMQANSGDGAIDRDTLRRWHTDPIEKLPVEKVRRAVGRFEQSFRLLETAARRERCTWEYPVRKEGFPYVNPFLSEYRTLSRLVALKAKLEIHDGDLIAALGTLRCGVALARDVGDGPNLIQHLVGLSMAAGMLRQIEGFIERPDAPNLYWALTALPDPLVNIRKAVQMESECLATELPELRTLEETVLSNEQVLDLWQRTALWVGYNNGNPDRWLDKVRDLAAAMERYPRAKTNLLERGYAAEKVEAWPALYVIVVDQYHQFCAVRDLSFKWTHVPYAQAREGLKQGERAISGLWKYGNAGILANPLVNALPAMSRIAFLDARLERDIAILRCVEAIRMYAADHEGKLPGSLAEITAVPVPPDPFNGKAFHYAPAGGKAILESPVPPNGGAKDGLRYEITLR
jgi:hypothetical protein